MNWLMLRGLSREARHWGVIHKHLIDLNPGSTIATIDLPGAGEKYRQSSPAKTQNYIFELRKEFLELKKNSEGPWSILSISLGSMIAMEWAHLHPRDFSSLILMNTSAANIASPFERMSLQNLNMLFTVLTSCSVKKKELSILKQTLNLKSPNVFLDEWTKIQTERPSSQLNKLKQLIAASRFTAPESLVPSVLVLAAKKDRLVNYQCSVRLAELYDAQIKIHPTAGHDIPLDDPDWVLEKLKEFTSLKDH